MKKIGKQPFVLALALAMGVLVSVPARATLFDRGNGLIYDDVLDITWTQNANLWGTTGTWSSALAWADGLSFGGFDDWRLATISSTSPTGSAFDCSSGTAAACAAAGNELGFMYYHNMDGSGDNRGTQTVDGVALNNVQFFYWSGTEFNFFGAWNFVFVHGGQGAHVKNSITSNTAWAVRPGDVFVVPVPATWLLLGAGLAGLGFGRRRGRPRR